MSESVSVLNYGGGIQTIAMCLMVRRGVLPKPDFIVAADTGREARSTWEYMQAYAQPLLAEIGLTVNVAPHDLATVDLYAKNGDLLLPVFTADGKLPTFCSVEWKARVVERWLRSQGASSGTHWIGFSTEERRRVKRQPPGPWKRRYPLLELMLTRRDCEAIIDAAGLPIPSKSACYMCPHRSNEEWREIRDKYPDQWADAVRIDHEVREADEHGAVYLHSSRVPLDQADLGDDQGASGARQCGFGLCFV